MGQEMGKGLQCKEILLNEHQPEVGTFLSTRWPHSDNPYLDVTLSDNIKWNSHINTIAKKADSTLGFLKRNLKHCPQDSRRTVYLSLVRSTLEYSSIDWDPYLQKDTDKLEKVQRQAVRFIKGNYTSTCSRDQGCVSQMLAELNLPPGQKEGQ